MVATCVLSDSIVRYVGKYRSQSYCSSMKLELKRTLAVLKRQQTELGAVDIK